MPLDNKIGLLGKISLFSGLTDDDLHTLFTHAVIRRYAKHTLIIQEGDESDSLYVITEGRVKVFLNDERGKEAILNYQEAGEYFGELALLDHALRSASVQALEPTHCVVITRTDFMRCLAMHPDIAFRVIRDLTARLRDLTDEVKSLALMDVYGRVARTLLKLAERKGDELVIERMMPRKELSNLVGCSREMVTRILKELERGGYICASGKRLIIKEKLPPGW